MSEFLGESFFNDCLNDWRVSSCLGAGDLECDRERGRSLGGDLDRECDLDFLFDARRWLVSTAGSGDGRPSSERFACKKKTVSLS